MIKRFEDSEIRRLPPASSRYSLVYDKFVPFGSRFRNMRIAFLLVVLTFSLSVSGQEKQEEKRINYFNPETWLLGDFSPSEFLKEPHQAWYANEFDNYMFDDDAFVELADIPADDIGIVIVLATWCPDSRRELPRFMKIIGSWGYPEERIRFIGTDSEKIAPVENYESFDIDRVPTFIFYRDKVELGRIIEYPKASLERDMVNILSK
jgi:hypothetical protein